MIDTLLTRTVDGLTVEGTWNGLAAVLSASRAGVELSTVVPASELLNAFYHPCSGAYFSAEEIDLLFPKRVYCDEEQPETIEQHSRKV